MFGTTLTIKVTELSIPTNGVALGTNKLTKIVNDDWEEFFVSHFTVFSS